MTHKPPAYGSSIALVVTLGGKPQIATFALDALLAMGVPVARVYVLHLSAADPRVKAALDSLTNEFRTHATYQRAGLTLESRPVRPVRNIASDGIHPVLGSPIEQVDDAQAADAIWMTTQTLIAALKSEGCAVHLCLTGGPRLMALQALSAASLMLGGGDECWHVFTPLDVREEAGDGAVLHAPDRGIRLVRVPLLPLGGLAPTLRSMAFAKPEDVIAAGERRLSAEHEKRCGRVWERLTPKQREVLRVFAKGATSHAEALKILSMSGSTLSTHISAILALVRDVWEEPSDLKLNHHHLRERFGGLPESFWR